MQNTQAAGNRILARWTTLHGAVRHLSGGILLSLGINAALVGDRIYTAHHPPAPKYILTDAHNNQCEYVPLDEPVMSDADLVVWVTQAAVAPFNFDHVHYRSQLSKDAQPYYTTNGWNSYASKLISDKTMEEIKKNAYTVSGVPERPAAIVDSGVADGVMTWVFEVPVLVQFHNLAGGDKQRLLARLTVVRMPPRFHPKGVAVDAITTRNVS